MTRSIQITLITAAIATTAVFVPDADARSFGGFNRGSFARVSSFSSPQIRSFKPARIAPRTNFVAARPIVRSIKPPATVRTVHTIVKPPIKVIRPPHIGDTLKPVIPPRIGPPTLVKLPQPLPPGLLNPPHLRPIDPGGNGAPPGKGNPPGAGNYPPPPPAYVGIGIGAAIGAVGVAIATAEEVPAATVQVDCEGYRSKWQETGDKYWKLMYYECTGQL